MVSRRLLRIKCFKALYTHFQTEDNTITSAEKNMLFSISKSYDLYHLMLRLIVDVAENVEETMEQRKKKLRPSDEDLNPNRRFIDNPIISQIRNSDNLNSFLVKSGLGWEEHPELIKKLTANLLDRAYYVTYMNKEEVTYQDHQAFIINFYKKEIEDFDYIFEILDDMSIFWMDEIEFITSSVISTIKCFSEQNKFNDVRIPPLYKNDGDVNFVKGLLNEVLVSYRDNTSYIDKFTINWDIERIALADKLLIHMTIAEFTTFKDIPISVSMNEYIDLAKFYSTPQSHVFINGVLDKIALDLEATGKISKK